MLWKWRQLMGQMLLYGLMLLVVRSMRKMLHLFEIVIGKGRHWISDLHPGICPSWQLSWENAGKQEWRMFKKKSTKFTIVLKSLIGISSGHTCLIFCFFLYSLYFLPSQMIVLANKCDWNWHMSFPTEAMKTCIDTPIFFSKICPGTSPQPTMKLSLT